ncbi:MAG: Nif3-like dinuclear metal center hexameric protein [Sideroxydans sp.]
MQLKELCDYIGTELGSDRFKDYCPNGLQVEGKAGVARIATAVTASQAVLEAASNWGADALIVHHGYFWRGENAPITGIKKRRIAHLLRHDISLLVYHLPLDAHPVLGNNAQLARLLGFVEYGRFGEQELACHGVLSQPQSLGDLVRGLAQKLRRAPQVIGDLNTRVARIAWCSGAAQSYFPQAVDLGVDAFLTGEISEQYVHVAEETGVAFIAAGHHATERYGIQALGQRLASRFALEHQFFDQQNPI